MNQIIKERYFANYAPRLAAFASEAGAGINAAGISAPHLPCFGLDYGAGTVPKVAIIGRDTRYWGDMTAFLSAASENPRAVLDHDEQGFHEFRFTNWNYDFGRTFWATLLKLLAAWHGVEDWTALRRREHPGILRSFLWAETNSVERFESTAAGEGAEYGAWEKLKAASERHFDSLSLLLDTFQPDLAIILSRENRESYWDRELHWTEVRERLSSARDEAGCGTLILHTDHPGYWNRNRNYDEVLAAILEQSRAIFDPRLRQFV